MPVQALACSCRWQDKGKCALGHNTLQTSCVWAKCGQITPAACPSPSCLCILKHSSPLLQGCIPRIERAQSGRQGNDPGPKRSDDGGKKPTISRINIHSKNASCSCDLLFSMLESGYISRQHQGPTCCVVMGNVSQED